MIETIYLNDSGIFRDIVTVNMDMQEPTYLRFDWQPSNTLARPSGEYGVFISKRLTPSGNVDLFYKLVIPLPTTTLVNLSWLVYISKQASTSPLLFGSLGGSAGGAGLPFHAFPTMTGPGQLPTPPNIYPQGVTTISSGIANTYERKLVGNWTPVSTSDEPECHCDIRQLMSQPHPEGCNWLKWKRLGKASK